MDVIRVANTDLAVAFGLFFVDESNTVKKKCHTKKTQLGRKKKN